MKIKVHERNKLASQLNCCTTTLRTYLCRAEFWHVGFNKINGKMYYSGLTEADIEKLQQYIKTRPKGCRKGLKKGTVK